MHDLTRRNVKFPSIVNFYSIEQDYHPTISWQQKQFRSRFQITQLLDCLKENTKRNQTEKVWTGPGSFLNIREVIHNEDDGSVEEVYRS